MSADEAADLTFVALAARQARQARLAGLVSGPRPEPGRGRICTTPSANRSTPRCGTLRRLLLFGGPT